MSSTIQIDEAMQERLRSYDGQHAVPGPWFSQSRPLLHNNDHHLGHENKGLCTKSPADAVLSDAG